MYLECRHIMPGAPGLDFETWDRMNPTQPRIAPEIRRRVQNRSCAWMVANPEVAMQSPPCRDDRDRGRQKSEPCPKRRAPRSLDQELNLGAPGLDFQTWDTADSCRANLQVFPGPRSGTWGTHCFEGD